MYQSRAERQARETLDFVPRYLGLAATQGLILAWLLGALRRGRISDDSGRAALLGLTMVDLIGFEANEEGAGVLRRFALMRNWYEVGHLRFGDFVSPDGLHMNDWGYDCIARQLAGAIGDAVARPVAATAAVTVSVR